MTEPIALLAAAGIVIFASAALARGEKRVGCNETTPARVDVPLGLVTILSFPAPPKEVVPGEAGFEFKTIRQDLIVKAQRPNAKTNLFVYLEGRRCFFHLFSARQGDEIMLVRDGKERELEIKFKDER